MKTTTERRLQAAVYRCAELREQLDATKEYYAQALAAERKLRRRAEFRAEIAESFAWTGTGGGRS